MFPKKTFVSNIPTPKGMNRCATCNRLTRNVAHCESCLAKAEPGPDKTTHSNRIDNTPEAHTLEPDECGRCGQLHTEGPCPGSTTITGRTPTEPNVQYGPIPSGVPTEPVVVDYAGQELRLAASLEKCTYHRKPEANCPLCANGNINAPTVPHNTGMVGLVELGTAENPLAPNGRCKHGRTVLPGCPWGCVWVAGAAEQYGTRGKMAL